jgi:hypothetical protein
LRVLPIATISSQSSLPLPLPLPHPLAVVTHPSLKLILNSRDEFDKVRISAIKFTLYSCNIE